MPIPSEIAALVSQLNQKLSQIEQEATAGLNLVRPLLSRFPDNVRLMQFFAFFSNALLFVEISRRRIRAMMERISASDVTAEEIQEAGEDLGTLRGQVLEVELSGRRLVKVLEELE